MQIKVLHHGLCVTFSAVISVFHRRWLGNAAFRGDIYCKPPAILCRRRLSFTSAVYLAEWGWRYRRVCSKTEILPRQIKYKWTRNHFQLFPSPVDCCNADCKPVWNMIQKSINMIHQKVINNFNGMYSSVKGSFFCQIIYATASLQQQLKHSSWSI